MKNLLSSIDVAIWMTLIVGSLILCLCIFKKHVLRRLPWFSAYVFAYTAENILLLVIAYLASYATYYYTFYVVEHVVSAMGFLTLIEFGRQVLPGLNLPHNKKAGAWLLAALGALAFFVSVWRFRYLENRIEVAVYLTVAVAFIFIAAYSRYLGLYWSRLLGGVSFTLGLLYLVDGATHAIAMAHYPYRVALLVRQISLIVNVLAVVAWTTVILLPWGESEMTEEDLQRFQQIVRAIERTFRRSVALELAQYGDFTEFKERSRLMVENLEKTLSALACYELPDKQVRQAAKGVKLMGVRLLELGRALRVFR